jgi:protein-S-isoprenylcysteine O-methyltransferase Ste14
MTRLAAKALFSLVALAAVTALLLFGLAGSVHYWRGWAYFVIFIGASLITTLDLLKRDPALLERRLVGGPTAEKRPVQRVIMVAASAVFIAMLVVPALDYRFGWSHVPLGIVILGDLMATVGFTFIFFVYRANTYTAATIQVTENQTVISTGPYAIVRHPMYASALLYVLGTPLALGSWWGLLAVAVMIPLLMWRLVDEERMLAAQLAGYTDYQQRVQHRLVPFVW